MLLDALYQEFRELKSKLDAVQDLILKYGGAIPNTEEEVDPYIINPTEFWVVTNFPLDGTWKEKIIAVLHAFDKPMSTKDIAECIYQQQEYNGIESDAIHIHNMVTQIASSMGRAGDIGVDNSGFRNKYYTLPE